MARALREIEMQGAGFCFSAPPAIRNTGNAQSTRNARENENGRKDKMRIREDVIETTKNGKPLLRFTLDKETPTAVWYIENTDFANAQAKGLSEQENEIEVLKREIRAYFETAFDDLEELERLDQQAAEEMRVDLGLEEYFVEDENSAYIGGGVYCTPNALKPLQGGGPITLEAGQPVKLTGFEKLT